MGQGEIIELLEKENKPLSRTEIAVKLDTSPIKVSIRIAKLLKHNEIKCIEIPRDLALKMYKCRKRMRVYYV